MIILLDVRRRNGEERLQPVEPTFGGELLPTDPLRPDRKGGRHELDGAHAADFR